jgi:hypothetical protein
MRRVGQVARRKSKVQNTPPNSLRHAACALVQVDGAPIQKPLRAIASAW